MSLSAHADGLASPVLTEAPPEVSDLSAPSRSPRRYTALAVGLPLLLGVIHVLVVAPHYHVGSFDDDAGYILAAKALLAGHGLTAHLASGEVMVGLYPPGYSALLVPLLWIFGNGFVALRVLSIVCYAALFPLTWYYLDRRGLDERLRTAVLFLMALTPSFATFGSMVMAETPFLVLFVVMLLLLERWEHSIRTLSALGVGVIVSVAGLVWLKEAALAMIPGVVIWLLWQHKARKAVAVAAGTLVLLVPVAIARIAAGVPLAGARYSQELGTYYSNGLFDRIGHVAHGFTWWFSTALPATVVPSGSPFPQGGGLEDVLAVISWHVALFTVVGFVVWFRHHRDATVVIVPLYVAETLLWPNVNERRVILVLPVILALYVLGGWTIARFILDWARRRQWQRPRLAPIGLCVLAALLIVAPLGAQFGRDYLFADGQSSSKPDGSRYMALLAALGRPGDVVETDYRSTVALFTGHRTANTAFVSTLADLRRRGDRRQPEPGQFRFPADRSGQQAGSDRQPLPVRAGDVGAVGGAPAAHRRRPGLGVRAHRPRHRPPRPRRRHCRCHPVGVGTAPVPADRASRVTATTPERRAPPPRPAEPGCSPGPGISHPASSR